MGRLKRRKRLPKNRFFGWLLPLLLAGIVILAIHVFVVLPLLKDKEVNLEEYIQANSLIVRTDTEDGLQNVYYLVEGKRYYAPDATGKNRSNPVAAGAYIAWEERSPEESHKNIVLYNVLTQALLQLSFQGKNGNVHLLDDGRLAWEQVVGNTSHIKYFDGQQTQSISGAYTFSKNPQLSNNKVTYAYQLAGNQWGVALYDLVTQNTELVTTVTQQNMWPRFVDGQLRTDLGPPPGRY